MKRNAFALMIALAGFITLPSVRADEWNKETEVNLNTPVAVPGQVLAPGNYIFKLADSQVDRHIVQIFNEDQSHLFATILAIPAYRANPTDETVFTLEEQPAGSPEAIGKWFYAGEQSGVEFLYPTER
jgi:hypothetical protein